MPDFRGIWEPLLIYFKLSSHVMSEIFSFLLRKNEKAAGNRSYNFCPCSTRLLPIKYMLTFTVCSTNFINGHILSISRPIAAN